VTIGLVLIVSLCAIGAMSFRKSTIEGKTFKDPRDGKEYGVISIGNQKVMAENLAYKPNTGNYWAYNNDTINVKTYGYLYDWESAKIACPKDGIYLQMQNGKK